jgi:2'-5' RNA ligase
MADLTGVLPAILTDEQQTAAELAVGQAYDEWLGTGPDVVFDHPFAAVLDATPAALDDLAALTRSHLERLAAGAALAEAAEQHTGAMIALYPTPAVQRKLAIKGGEPVREIHLTLAFLGKAADLPDPERLADVVRGWAASTPPLTGVVSGTGKFTAGPDPVTYVSPDLPGLPAARERLVAALTAAGYEPADDHGFSPHMTVAYDDVDVEPPNLKLKFGRASLVLADRRQHFDLAGAT